MAWHGKRARPQNAWAWGCCYGNSYYIMSIYVYDRLYGSRNMATYIKFLNRNPAVGRAQHSAHLQSHEALLVAERSSAGGGSICKPKPRNVSLLLIQLWPQNLCRRLCLILRPTVKDVLRKPALQDCHVLLGFGVKSCLLPAFAMTAHQAQGQTIEEGVVMSSSRLSDRQKQQAH